MTATAVEIVTDAGVMDARYFTPDADGVFPGVIFFMDGIGVRPALWDMGTRLAAKGYCVLMPNLFYRTGKELSFDPKTAFVDPDQRAHLMALIGAATERDILAYDIAACVRFMDVQKGVTKGAYGTTGYCMGGLYAMSAAGLFPSQIAAAGSFHAGRLASDRPNSPHLLAAQIKAELYFGHADQDASMPAEMIALLETTLHTAGVTFTSELYAGARHGYAIRDLAVYDDAASERHWANLLALFERRLR
jgi:carboxymethylenebutenolidase